MGFPRGSASKESAGNAGDLRSIPGLGRSPGEGNGYPLQYSDLENSMDYSHGVAKSQTGLRDFHSHPVIGGAEKASMVKGNISHLGVPESWEEGRAEMEEERQKFVEI